MSKDEIFQEVWPGTYVTDDALTKCIGELRRVSHAPRREPSIIETIAKRGYRVAVPVVWDTRDTMASGEPGAGAAATALGHEQAEPAAAAEAGKRPGDSLAALNASAVAAAAPVWKRRALALGSLLLLTLAILLAVSGGRLRALLSVLSGPPPIQSIAVLPLTDLSGNPGQEYFAEGMTEELITELVQIEAWRVISRTSVMRYKGTRKPLPEIARELRVDGIVEGTVLRSGSRVRVTAQLIRAATDTHLWSGQFERELSDVLALQRDIARGIAAELRAKVGSEEQVRTSRKRRVVPEAYEDYLKGCYLLNRNHYASAASHFEQASARDPGFALAHALLYEAEAMQAFTQDLPLSDTAMTAMETALKLDGTLAEAHTAAGDARAYWDWDWKAGEAEFRRAVDLDRSSAHAAAHYATCLHILARWDAALREYRRALELDPVSPQLNMLFLAFLVDTHSFERAIEQLRNAIEIDPNNGSAYSQAGRLYQLQGREDEAIAAYLKADNLGGRSAEQIRALENAARMGGVRGYWRKHLEMLQDRAKQSRVPPLDFASLYIRMGEKDKAMKMLETAYQQRAPRLVWLRASAVWEPLRSDPRFQSLLRRIRFPE